MKTIQQHFDEEAKRHDEHFLEELQMKEFYDQVERLLAKHQEKKRILVLGCGTGLEIQRIQHPAQVTAVDISEEMLKQLRKRKLFSGIVLKPICASFLEFDFGTACYDLVLSCYALHHFNPKQKEDLYRRIYRCLDRSGGMINGDLIARNSEEEQKNIERALDTYERANASFGSLHVDLPLSLTTEQRLLKSSGFRAVSVEYSWTYSKLLYAQK